MKFSLIIENRMNLFVKKLENKKKTLKKKIK